SWRCSGERRCSASPPTTRPASPSSSTQTHPLVSATRCGSASNLAGRTCSIRTPRRRSAPRERWRWGGEPTLALPEAHLLVAPVAERLVLGMPTPTQRLAVPHLVRGAVGGNDLDAAANPQRTVAGHRDRCLVRQLVTLIGVGLRDEPARGAQLRHM